MIGFTTIISQTPKAPSKGTPTPATWHQLKPRQTMVVATTDRSTQSQLFIAQARIRALTLQLQRVKSRG